MRDGFIKFLLMNCVTHISNFFNIDLTLHLARYPCMHPTFSYKPQFQTRKHIFSLYYAKISTILNLKTKQENGTVITRSTDSLHGWTWSSLQLISLNIIIDYIVVKKNLYLEECKTAEYTSGWKSEDGWVDERLVFWKAKKYFKLTDGENLMKHWSCWTKLPKGFTWFT